MLTSASVFVAAKLAGKFVSFVALVDAHSTVGACSQAILNTQLAGEKVEIVRQLETISVINFSVSSEEQLQNILANTNCIQFIELDSESSGSGVAGVSN